MMDYRSRYEDLLCECGEVLDEPAHKMGTHVIYICYVCGKESEDFINEDIFKEI